MSSLKKTLILLAVPVLLALAYASAAPSGKKKSWDLEAAQRKADYVFGQACVANAIDSLPLAYALAEYASSLNPEDIDIATFAARMKLPVVTDSLEYDQTCRLIIKQYYAHPEDYENGVMAASAAKSIGEIDDVVRVWEKLDSVYPSRQDIAPSLAAAYTVQYILGDTSAYSRAMNIYNRLENGMGKDIGLTSYKIRAYQLKKDTAAIVREIDELTTALPAESEAWIFAGQTYQTVGLDSVKELEFFRRACQLDSTNGQAFIALADYYKNHGDTLAYEREQKQALLCTNLDIDTKIDILRPYVSSLAQDSLRWPELKATFDSLTIINPGEAEIHAMYGLFQAYIEDPAATEQFSYALSLDPTNANIRQLYIIQSLSHNDTIAAINAGREGMQMNPDNFYFPIVAASMLSQQKKIAEAMAVIDSVNITEVKNPQAVASFLTTAADIYQLGDSIDLALKTYDRAIALSPDEPMAYNNAAYAMAQHNGDLDKALRYARYAVLSEVDNPTYLDTYAWVYFKQKNYPEAKSYIDKALRQSNLVPDSSAMAVDSVLAVDSVAVDSALVVEIAQPEESAVKTDSADVEELNTETEVVEEEVYSGAAEVLEHAGDIYFMYGLPDKAVEFWERAAALDPDNELLNRKVKNKTYFYK